MALMLAYIVRTTYNKAIPNKADHHDQVTTRWSNNVKKVFEGLESIESRLNIIYLVLESCGDQVAIIRTTGNDFLTFSDELAEKVKNAADEHFAVDDEHCSVILSSFDSAVGISNLLFNFNDEGGDLPMTLSPLTLY